MLNIFNLNDTLIVSVSELQANEITKNNDFVIGKNNNELCFINIFNLSKYLKLNNGLVFPDKSILENIKLITNYDLSNYFTNGFVVGKIIEEQPIDGTHLHKCKVDIGSKVLNIICGAANARKDLKVVVATNGTSLFNGKMITSGKVLNNFSGGMLCSYKELNIDKQSNGIIELNESFTIGQYFKDSYIN